MLQEVLGPRPFPSATVRWSSTDHFDKRDVLATAPRDSDVAVRAWVDLSHAGATHLYFANGPADRFLVRDLQLSPATTALDREVLGQVLELSVTALLENAEWSLDRSQAESLLDPDAHPEPAPKPRDAISASRPSARPPLEVATFYAAQAYAPEVPVVQGPGMAAVASVLPRRFTLSLWASAQYQLPVDLDRDGIGVRLWSAAARGGVEVAVRVGRAGRGPFSNAFFALAVGAGCDFVRVTPLPGSVDATASLATPYWSLDPVVGVVLRAQVQLAPHVDLEVAPLVDFYVDPAHYDFRTAGVVSTVLSPFSVRPGALVGLALH